jgi:hypothetical protein
VGWGEHLDAAPAGLGHDGKKSQAGQSSVPAVNETSAGETSDLNGPEL